MKKFRRFASRKVFITFIMSYLIILLIPIALGSIAYIANGRVLEEEVGNSSIIMLKHISSSIDSGLTAIENMMYDISVNSRVVRFLSVEAPLDSDSRYRAYEILWDLSPYSRTKNIFIKDYYIYFKNSDFILTSSSTYTPDLFYTYKYAYKDKTFEQWHEEMQNIGYVYMKIEPCEMIINQSTENVLTYSQSLPITEKDNPTGFLTVLIDKRYITDYLIDAAKGGFAYVIDQNNNIMIKSGDWDDAYIIDSALFTAEEGLINSNQYGESIVVTYARAPKTGWVYVTVIPRAELMERLKYLQNITISIAACCLILGLLAAYLLATKSYMPIKNTVETLIKWKDDVPRKDIGEFEYIHESIIDVFNKNSLLENHVKKVIAQNEQMSNLIHKNRNTVKNSLLTAILKGLAADFESVKSWLELYNIEFPYDRFVVIMIHIDDASQFIEDDAKDWKLLRFAVTSVAEELANESNIAYTVELDQDTMAMIVNISGKNKDDATMDYFLKMSRWLKDFIKERFNTIITVGIGEIQKGLENIKLSYVQAQKAMDYRIVKGTSSVILFNEIVDRDKEYYYPINDELRLVNLIRAGDIQECDNLLRHIFEENFNKRKLSLTLLKCLFFDIMSTVVKVLDAIKIDYAEIFGDMDPVDRLTSCETFEDMYNQTMSIFGAICEYINLHKKEEKDRLKEKLLEFIHNNITEENLSQTTIAEYLGVSTPYLSKFFKNEIGVSMVDYINNLRIEKVKEMLKNTELTLNEIAQQIGYTSSKTLIRIFKQHEGITPGKFRESL